MRYTYAVQVVREDGTEVAQAPVAMDWEPAREWLRLQALARGLPPERAFLLDCGFTPLWDPGRGQPFLAGFTGASVEPEGIPETFPLDYFADLARGVTRRLVADGKLEKGAVVRCLPVAFLEAAESEPRGPLTRSGRVLPPRIPVEPGSLRDFVEGDSALQDAAQHPLPVFIPERVLEEVRRLTVVQEGARETGGILIGRLHRDEPESRLFLTITAQIPARHTEASSAKLTFTPATWADVQSAIALRGQGEIMLGWWHSHPVREWCKDCPPEKRARCALARGFLSEDDRLLHRTVFPRAHGIALVVSDLSEGGPTLSLFGWSRGLLEPREFGRLREEHHAAVG